MSRRARIGILIALGGLGLAALGILLIGSFVRTALVPQAPPTPLPPLTEKVVVVRQGVIIGSVLRAEDLAEVEVPVEVAPRGAAHQVEAVAGRITRIPLAAGEIVMPHHLADPTNINRDLALVIGDNQVLMAFPLVDLMTNLDILQRGDVVDILVSITQTIPPSPEDRLLAASGEEPEPESLMFTFNAMQRVEISAVVMDVVQTTTVEQTTAAVAEGAPQIAPTPPAPQGNARALLLALTPQDALVLKHLKDSGAVFDFVLRSPTSTQLYELDPVYPQYLIDRYQLELTR